MESEKEIFINDKLKLVKYVYDILMYDNLLVLDVLHELFGILFDKNKVNFKISISNDYEIIIFTKNNSFIKHIIIDGDANIEYLEINRKCRINSWNKHYENVNKEILEIISDLL